MKEIFKYEFMLVINGNAKVRVFFTDSTNKIITISPEQLAAYEAILKQPHVEFDPVNNFFITRDRLENKNLKGF